VCGCIHAQNPNLALHAQTQLAEQRTKYDPAMAYGLHKKPQKRSSKPSATKSSRLLTNVEQTKLMSDKIIDAVEETIVNRVAREAIKEMGTNVQVKESDGEAWMPSLTCYQVCKEILDEGAERKTKLHFVVEK